MLNNTSQFDLLKEKLSTRHKEIQDKFYDRHKEALSWAINNTRQLALTGLGSAMLLTAPPALPTLPAAEQLLAAPKEASNNYIDLDNKTFMLSDLGSTLPNEMRPLTIEEDKRIEEILSRNFGIKVRAEMEGKRLNRTYGLIGAEQHLARFSDDTMEGHFDNAADQEKYYSSGMAPGLGGWGHFVNRLGGDMSPQEKIKIATEREKYYIAVQSFLAPGYHDHVREYVDFFGFRKMLIINPQNGKAMVVVIGDAGPAEWTGKHLGGSPEVMKYLERVDGRQRGPVLYYFLDDPNNKIPLGPIEVR